MKRRHLRVVEDGPYGTAALAYHEAGWAPIPLAYGKKLPPPTGWTGGSREYSGQMPSREQVAEWVAKSPGGNLALRLMDGWIGIDADFYDGKAGVATLAAAEKEWGKLPRTIMSGARTDGSGVRLFRVPTGLRWPGQLDGGGVELCRWDHRFVVAAPSWHGKLALPYKWRDSETFEVLLDADGDPFFPEAESSLIAELPAAWVEGLTRKRPWRGFFSADLTNDEASQWLEERNGPELCSKTEKVLEDWQNKVMRAGPDGGIFQFARDGAWALIRDAAKGHSGVLTALAKLKRTYEVAFAERPDSRAVGADGDWKRFVFDGIRKVAEEDDLSDVDKCSAEPADVARAVGTANGKIVIGNTPDAIRELGKALRYGAIPDTYSRRGELVRVRLAIGEDKKERLIADPFNVDSLREELARHCQVVAPVFGKDGELEAYKDKSPAVEVLKSVLTQRDWRPLPVLTGIIGAPVFREDGTLLQDPGYDSATGLYYAPREEVEALPVKPSPDTVAAERLWLTDQFLRDFPWEAPADFANYLALLVTPMLRPVLGPGVLTPFGCVTARTAGSGKSLLALNIPAKLYRMTHHAWGRREEERHKVITTSFADDSQIVLFDNVGDNDRIDSPALAKLLTSPMWQDRRMGKNTEVLSFVNNRLWMATGNNISLGGDMASRTVLVRLDPKMERPEFRAVGEFVMGDLLRWLESPRNVARLTRCLMLLALDWVAAGIPTEEFVMRGFTQWASALGGFLKHHGVGGFLANVEALREADSEEEEWGSWLADLRAEAKGKALTAAQIHALYASAFGTDVEGKVPMPARADGSTPNVRGLGVMMQKRTGRFFNGLTLDSKKQDGTRYWKVVTVQERLNSG